MTIKHLTEAADQYFMKELRKKTREVSLIGVLPNSGPIMEMIYDYLRKEIKKTCKRKNKLK